MTESNFYVAGIGASAGGIEALQKVLENLPEEPLPLALIIAQHLSPRLDTKISQILQRSTKWKIKIISQHTVIKPNNIYINPPGFDLLIKNRELLLSDQEEGGPKPSINRLFYSLAREYKNYAIGIILSGTGNDGSEGLRDIIEKGGEVIVQDPETTINNGMPNSALNKGFSLTVLKNEEIGGYLKNVTGNGSIKVPRNFPVDENLPSSIRERFELAEKSGHYKDFLQLKIRQRSNFLGLNGHQTYLDYVKKHPEEVENLHDPVYSTFGVKFDPDYIRNFTAEVVKKLIPNPGDHLRIWMIGAGSGEFCYLFIILLLEHLGSRSEKIKIQIFATDSDNEQLQFAKKGIYPNELFDKLPRNLLNKYLIRYDHGAEMVKKIKTMILFSYHQLHKDPPLVKQDMIIDYSSGQDGSIEEQTLINLHYGLKTGGFLVLNQKVQKGNLKPFFKLESSNFNVYRKVDSPEINDLRYKSLKRIRQVNKVNAPPKPDIMEEAMEKIFLHQNFPLVIINQNKEIVEIKGDFKDFFRIPDGNVNRDIFNLLHPELKNNIRTLIYKVKKTGESQTGSTVFFHHHKLKIDVYPLSRDCFAIYFRREASLSDNQVEPNNELPAEGKKELIRRIKFLEEELSFSQEQLNAYSEELELSNEEVQGLNQELHNKNTEMRQSNEELSASNEELQSANEELNTAIAELRLANTELIEKESELISSREKLEKSEALYRSLAQNFPNGIIAIVNKEFKITFVEGKGLEDLNTTKEVVIDQHISKLFITEEIRQITYAIKRTFEGEKLSLDFQHHDLYFTLSTIPLHSIGQEVENVMFVTQNITENKRLENSLKKMIEENNTLLNRERVALDKAETQRNILSHLFMQAPAAICMLNGPSLVIELANEYFQQILGNDKLLGKSLKKDLRSLIDPKILEKIEEVYHSGEHFIGSEVPVKTRNNNKMQYYNLIYQSIRNENGGTSGVIIYAYRVTELVEARKVVEENAIKLRLLLETLPQMAWTARPDGFVDYVNQRWLDYTGLSYQDSIGSGWTLVQHEDDVDTHFKKWKYSVLNEKPFENEVRFKQASDKIFRWHIVRAVPIRNEKQEILHWVGTCTDIDDQKRLEEKKDEFFSIASHELKTPLTGVKAYVQLIDEMVTQYQNQTLQLYLSKAITGVNKLNKLINDLLDISRIQAGKVQFSFDYFDFDQLAHDALENLQHISHQHKITLEGSTGVNYYGDRLRLEQVFSNFISNAIKYSPDAKKIIVKLACENEQIIVSFTDFGIGIEQEKREKLFERYYRAEEKSNTTTGLGIGLYITAEIIRRHGGNVWVESEIGKGSVFYFSLPVLPKN